MRTTPATWPGVFPVEDPDKPTSYFWLELGERSIPLQRGEIIMGRSRSCQVLVDDMLVSRQHARLFVSSDSVFVEDYDSSNGVIVNESVIVGATRLKDGDRLILGSHEYVMRSTPAPSVGSLPPSPPAAIVAPRRSTSTPKQSGTSLPTRPAPAAQHPLIRSHDHDDDDQSEEPTLSTEKQDALSTMGRLADRMMSLGRHDAAAKLLADHLRGLLAKLKEGKPVSRSVLELMGYYSMKLADSTRDGSWANLGLEAHMIARRPLPPRAILLLETQNRLPLFDRALFVAYKGVLRDVSPLLTADEREHVERIQRILR